MPGPLQIGQLEAILGLNIAPFERDLTGARASMMKASRFMKQTGRTMTAAVTLPIVGIGAASVKMAVDFEKAMSKVEGLVGVASGQVQEWRKDVLAMAGPTAKAPQELAEALFFVTSAGLRGQDALDVLEASAKASAAGLGETKVVADLVTSAVNAYGISNLSAAQATDILTAAVREGKAEAPELASSMGMVLPIASNLGVGFDQVGAAIASMTRTGTNASTASIQLRQILASLLKPTQQAEEALGEMGTSSKQLRRQLREEGLVSVLGFLAEQMKTNDQAMAQVFPNIRALSGALDIMGANAEDNVGIFQRMTDTTGILNQAFGAAAKTAAFQFDQAMAELKATGIELGEALTPLFIDMVGNVKQLAQWFGGLSERGKKLAISIGLLAAAAGPALLIMGQLVSVLVFITGPVGIAIAAFGALAAATVYLWQNWDAVKERISDWSWWRNMLIDMVQFLLENNPTQFFIDAWNHMMTSIGRTDKIIPNLFQGAIDVLEGLKVETKEYQFQFSSFVEAIKKGAKEAADALLGLSIGSGGRGPGPITAPSPGRGGISIGQSSSPTEGLFGRKDILGSITSGLSILRRELKKSGEDWFDWQKKLVEIWNTTPTIVSLGFKRLVDVVNTNMNLMHFALDGITSAFVELGTAIGENLGGMEDQFATPLQRVLLVVANFAKTLGTLLIGIGTFMVATGLFAGPGGLLIGAGVGLVALGAGASAAINKSINKKREAAAERERLQGMRSGGFVTKGGFFQLHKNEVVSLPAGSAVTPASRVGSMGGSNARIEITLRKFIIETDKERARLGR